MRNLKSHEKERMEYKEYLHDAARKGELHGISNKIPESPKEAEIMVAENYMNLKIIPDHLITEEMCLKVLEIDQSMLFSIPAKFLNEKICSICFNKNIDTIEQMPEEYLTEEMIEKIIKEKPYLFRSIPDSKKTEEMSIMIVESQASLIDSIPKQLQTTSVWLAYFKQIKDTDSIYSGPEMFYFKDVPNGLVKDLLSKLKIFYKSAMSISESEHSISIHKKSFKFSRLDSEEWGPIVKTLNSPSNLILKVCGLEIPLSLDHFIKQLAIIRNNKTYKDNECGGGAVSKFVLDTIPNIFKFLPIEDQKNFYFINKEMHENFDLIKIFNVTDSNVDTRHYDGTPDGASIMNHFKVDSTSDVLTGLVDFYTEAKEGILS